VAGRRSVSLESLASSSSQARLAGQDTGDQARLADKTEESAGGEQLSGAVEESAVQAVTSSPALLAGPRVSRAISNPALPPGSPAPALVRHRSVSRSLVPKMRKFFEKSRSCDPELSQSVKIVIETEARPEPEVARQDGTESARSSFVLLTPGGHSDSASLATLSDCEERGGAGQSGARPGLVRQWATRVRSMMGRQAGHTE